MSVAGLLLAAGAGRRMGGPKSLLRDAHGVPFLDRAVGLLLDGGCATVTVVLGASAEEARALLDEAGWSEDPAVDVVVARTGTRAWAPRCGPGCAPWPGGAARRRWSRWWTCPTSTSGCCAGCWPPARGPGALVRSTYGGEPGHPVLIGRDHWAGVVETAAGDRGARTYFRTHEPLSCECGDLATGRDLDRPEDLLE